MIFMDSRVYMKSKSWPVSVGSEWMSSMANSLFYCWEAFANVNCQIEHTAAWSTHVQRKNEPSQHESSISRSVKKRREENGVKRERETKRGRQRLIWHKGRDAGISCIGPECSEVCSVTEAEVHSTCRKSLPFPSFRTQLVISVPHWRAWPWQQFKSISSNLSVW